MLQVFVAGLRSNPDYTSEVRDKAGVLPCIQCDLSMKRMYKLREQSHIYYATEKQQKQKESYKASKSAHYG